MERFLGVLTHGESVSEHLGRVELVSQAIENRDTCVFSQLFHHRLVEPAVLDAVIHTPQDAGRVLHGLLVANV